MTGLQYKVPRICDEAEVTTTPAKDASIRDETMGNMMRRTDKRSESDDQWGCYHLRYGGCITPRCVSGPVRLA